MAFNTSPWARAAQAMLFAIAVASVSGCGSLFSNEYPPAPPQASQDDYSYIIGAGDTVNIIVSRNPELSMSVPVRLPWQHSIRIPMPMMI